MNNNKDPPSKNHHVAWADRIGLNKRWAEAIKKCLETYGTPFFPTSVNAFRMIIINMKSEGPQLKTITDNYVDNDIRHWKNNTLNEWIENDPINAQSDGWIRDTKKCIEEKSYELICNFMIQLLEDYGFCFYESSIEEDEMQ